MVSQPSMRRILRTGICLLGLSTALGACGQNEGGRCQVDSDCASGLTCTTNSSNSSTGNGICRSSNTSTPDAATNDDTSSTAPSSSLDLGLDTPSSGAVDLPSVDSESLDASGID